MIVTTFSPKGYVDYGRKFLETYRQYCDYPLVVYVEDGLMIKDAEVRNLYDVPGCKKFLAAVQDYQPKSYRHDINKFSRKVFAMTDAAMRHEGKMAFIGADTVFHSKVPDDFLNTILKDVYLAYLGRKKMHSETDFIAFDTKHPSHNLFIRLFLRMYTTGAFRHMKYYCDSDAFDFVRELLGPPENNLNECGDENHPFVNSILGKFMDHCKGPLRKQRGSSFDSDYIGSVSDRAV